ncbi:hypothetical protein ACJJIG_12105 [Microbulbifer sp. SSSA007]|uniref:hypothetical protein n=1 Tax=Microbulbifer sp. SSSA007 TaxID=3243379 RepID=UPI00403A66CA
MYCVDKGKDHKPYEYGSKASIVSTAKDGIILIAMNHHEKIHDSKTLDEVISKAYEVRESKIEGAIWDRVYRGKEDGRGCENNFRPNLR